MDHITIFGLGTLGSHFALLLTSVYRNVFNYRIIDYDSVALRNVGIQAYQNLHVDLLKTEALQSLIYSNAGILAQAVNLKVTAPSQFPATDLLIEAVDNPAAIALTQRLPCPVLHLKFTIQHDTPIGQIVWNAAYNFGGLAIDKADPCNVFGMKAFAWVMAGHAVNVVWQFATTGKMVNKIVTLKNVTVF